MRHFISNALKGVAMGAANVIPGVSGGTMALITGIFERLINSLKSFDLKAIRLLFKGKINDFVRHTDLVFLLAILIGILIAIVSLARLFDYLFEHYPVYIWAFFFGLVLASVYFVGKTVKSWQVSVIISFMVGTAIAVSISVLNPASTNESFVYLMLCGVAAVCSMILPGLSGSFILLVMGNYQLVMIDAINNKDLGILLPVIIGAAVGLVAFSHFLSWLLKKFKDQTISLLTGFILGSLSILWPWKNIKYLRENGELVLKEDGNPIIKGYEWLLPDFGSQQFWIAFAFILIGIVSIWLLEKTAEEKDLP
ncbi:MAG: DUF368 domain-containing protein [Bacteroidales bacterium]|nr:DUF368 domain-containing protein [Bacteroidales bacterium]MCF8343089.1 DUF368 domain-containing protein [Bacteroidales bacterium]MCF8375351.1 DUF368 domain-containing protein [Bacteroidales bacterium]MCF8400207.1 DUF368 domain-containing protein [Bacteroidales bacterium]